MGTVVDGPWWQERERKVSDAMSEHRVTLQVTVSDMCDIA